MQTGTRGALSRPQSHAFSADGAAPPQGHWQARSSTQPAVASPGALAIGLSLSHTSSCGEGATTTVTQPPPPRTQRRTQQGSIGHSWLHWTKNCGHSTNLPVSQNRGPRGSRAQAERQTLSLVLPRHLPSLPWPLPQQSGQVPPPAGERGEVGLRRARHPFIQTP